MDDNPVKAHLAAQPAEYPYGSAAGRCVLDAWPLASGAKAQEHNEDGTAGLKPRPSDAFRE
jgi:hypothetical protein